MAPDRKMTWERWRDLSPDQKEWEHFSYHQDLQERLESLESGKWRKTLGQVASSFVGGIAFWVAVLTFWKGLLPAFCK